jgi:type I restriction enzyme S subunit
MTDLKPGWQRVKFGEVVRLNKETCKDPEAAGVNRVIGLEHLEPGDLRVRSWADVADGTTFSNRVRPGQVLFGKRRAYQRKVAVADFDAVCSGDIYVFESADRTQLLQELLPYICQTEGFFDYAVGTSAGSLSPRTNWKSLVEYEFALPPLEEQGRAKELLRTATDRQEAAFSLVNEAEKLRRSLLVDLYSPKPGWTRTSLGNRYEIQLGKKLSHETSAEYERMPYLRNANVQWNRLVLDDIATMPFNSKEREKYRLRDGDILACEGRHVGKSAIWRCELPEAYYQMSLHRLRPREKSRDAPIFMLHYLEYCSLMGIFAAATGETTIPHMSAIRFSSVHLYFPGLEIQEEIAHAIANANLALERSRERALQSCALTNAILSSLLESQ